MNDNIEVQLELCVGEVVDLFYNSAVIATSTLYSLDKNLFSVSNIKFTSEQVSSIELDLTTPGIWLK